MAAALRRAAAAAAAAALLLLAAAPAPAAAERAVVGGALDADVATAPKSGGSKRRNRGGGKKKAAAAGEEAAGAAAKKKTSGLNAEAGAYVPPNRREGYEPARGNATAPKRGKDKNVGTSKSRRENRSRARFNLAYASLRRRPNNANAQVELALECADLKVDCRLDLSCHPISCRKTWDGGREVFVVSSAPEMMRTAMDAWATDEGRGCRVVEKPSKGVSCQKFYFAMR